MWGTAADWLVGLIWDTANISGGHANPTDRCTLACTMINSMAHVQVLTRERAQLINSMAHVQVLTCVLLLSH